MHIVTFPRMLFISPKYNHIEGKSYVEHTVNSQKIHVALTKKLSLIFLKTHIQCISSVNVLLVDPFLWVYKYSHCAGAYVV